MNVKVVRYKAYEKNTMRGFMDVVVEDSVVITGCTHHENYEGKEWVNLPSRKEQDGKYYDIVRFPSKEKYWSFQDSCRKAIKAYLIGKPEEGKQDDIPF